MGMRVEPRGLRLQSGASLEIRITQPHFYQLEIRAIVPIRKDGRIRLYPKVLSTMKDIETETELWAAISEFAQGKLCDCADRAEVKGAAG